MKQLFSIMWNLQTHYHFKLDFQKCKDNQLQSWNSPVEYANRKSKHDIFHDTPWSRFVKLRTLFSCVSCVVAFFIQATADDIHAFFVCSNELKDSNLLVCYEYVYLTPFLHHNGFAWTFRRLKSPVTRLFRQPPY